MKYKSFTIAAEMLGTSQPTISTHIRILEEELNSRLLIRTARSFEITARGWELYECAQNILKLREDMINRWNEKESKVIQLGVSTIPSAYILPEVLRISSTWYVETASTRKLKEFNCTNSKLSCFPTKSAAA